MTHDFKVVALDAAEHEHLFTYAAEKLKSLDAVCMRVDAHPGFPCRVSLQDAGIGEEVILFTYTHHKVRSPYYSSGAVFIRQNARTARLAVNELPAILTHRVLSLRAYNDAAMMIDARTVQGVDTGQALEALFNNAEVGYIHIHNAGPGCYNCRVVRV